MRVFYESKEAAMDAATAYKKENGGYIHEAMIPELPDEDTGRIIGACSAIIVSDAEDYAESTREENFYYNFEEM